MVFTSTRDGDLDLYTCDLDGQNVVRVTSELGYDGGAFFSPDGEWLVWRASRPSTPEDIAKYKGLLSKGMVEPTSMELFVARTDGSEMRQITELGGANWAPFFHPDGKRILFSSNHATGRFPFNIYMVDITGENLTQITYDEAFDSFPMFSPTAPNSLSAPTGTTEERATPTFSWRIGSSDADLRSMGDLKLYMLNKPFGLLSQFSDEATS